MTTGKKKNNSGGDARRAALIKDIGDLAHIPEIQEYFSEALERARKKFQDKIKLQYGQKTSKKEDIGE